MCIRLHPLYNKLLENVRKRDDSILHRSEKCISESASDINNDSVFKYIIYLAACERSLQSSLFCSRTLVRVRSMPDSGLSSEDLEGIVPVLHIIIWFFYLDFFFFCLNKHLQVGDSTKHDNKVF